MNYKTIKTDGMVETTIKKSRFLCYLKRIETEEEGRAFIAAIKKEHHKANHSCSAMIIGQDGQLKRSSDDGEPSGTAGVPMLTVLEKQGLTNLVAVVTRYFGGIKLGAGGLIRAYAGSVANALTEIGLVQVKEQEGLEIQLTYPQYQTLANFLAEQGLMEQNTAFADLVTTQLYLDPDQVEPVLEQLTDFYHGKVTANKIDPQVVEVPISPLDMD